MFGASEEAVLVVRDEDGVPTHVFVATNRGLIDARVTFDRSGVTAEYQVRSTPWGRIDARLSGDGRFDQRDVFTKWSLAIAGFGTEPTVLPAPRHTADDRGMWQEFAKEIVRLTDDG